MMRKLKEVIKEILPYAVIAVVCFVIIYYCTNFVENDKKYPGELIDTLQITAVHLEHNDSGPCAYVGHSFVDNNGNVWLFILPNSDGYADGKVFELKIYEKRGKTELYVDDDRVPRWSFIESSSAIHNTESNSCVVE